jgi:hypothetical protein
MNEFLGTYVRSILTALEEASILLQSAIYKMKDERRGMDE